jgi:2,5-diketo-D-gluconate reductase A
LIPSPKVTPHTTLRPTGDPAKKATYDAKQCRLNTWKALVEIWQSGRSKAIGVANYAISDLQEIIDSGMPLPAVNQVPFHLYNAAAQMALLAFCKAHKIVLLSYSPLGIPDWHEFPTPALPARTTLLDPVLLQVAAAHAPATPAQVVLAWLWALGLPSNPRTMNAQHMSDNLKAISTVTLSAAEVHALSTRPLDTCQADPDFYECVPSGDAVAPPHPWAFLA